jgi:hypothetical protein
VGHVSSDCLTKRTVAQTRIISQTRNGVRVCIIHQAISMSPTVIQFHRLSSEEQKSITNSLLTHPSYCSRFHADPIIARAPRKVLYRRSTLSQASSHMVPTLEPRT